MATVKYLTEPQVQRLTDHCRTQSAAGSMHGAMDWMMVHLGLGAGLTVAELANLRVSDCRTDDSNPSIHVRCGKGGKPGDVVIGTELRDHLRQFISLKSEWGQDVFCDAFLLVTSNGKPYTRSGLQKRFKSLAAAVGLPGVSLNCLRHTFCRELLRKTGNLKLVQKQARHARMASTVTYADLWDGNGLEVMEQMA